MHVVARLAFQLTLAMFLTSTLYTHTSEFVIQLAASYHDCFGKVLVQAKSCGDGSINDWLPAPRHRNIPETQFLA